MPYIMAIAGLAFGIFALVYAFVPSLGIFLSMPCAVVGLVLSIIGHFKNRKQGKGVEVAVAGMVISVSAFLLSGFIRALSDA